MPGVSTPNDAEAHQFPLGRCKRNEPHRLPQQASEEKSHRSLWLVAQWQSAGLLIRGVGGSSPPEPVMCDAG